MSKSWPAVEDIAIRLRMGKNGKLARSANGVPLSSIAPVKRFGHGFDKIMAQLLKGGSTKPLPDSSQKWLQRTDASQLPAAEQEASARLKNLNGFHIVSDDTNLCSELEEYLLSSFGESSLYGLTYSFIKTREIVEACTQFQANSLLNGIAFDFRIFREPFGFNRTRTIIEAYIVGEYFPVWEYYEPVKHQFDEYYSLIPSEYRNENLSEKQSDDRLTGAVSRALKAVGLGQEHAQALTTALVAELEQQQFAISPAASLDVANHVSLPAEAPEIYTGIRSGEAPPDFIRRVYAPWVGNGLTKADLRKLDPGLYRALYNWVGRGNALPDDLPLPTRQEANDKLVEGFIENSGKPLNAVLAEARRIESAARYRMKEK